jgi:hypothetical protein
VHVTFSSESVASPFVLLDMQLALMPVGVIDIASVNLSRSTAKSLTCNKRNRRHHSCFAVKSVCAAPGAADTSKIEEYMLSASPQVIPLTQRSAWPRGARSLDAEHVVLDAIRERRLLSVVYDGAVEPQRFAPYVLYFGEGGRVLLGGCEITKKRVQWRDIEVAHVRRVELNDTTFTPGALFNSKAVDYPYGIISAIDARR